jgi:hypothetical protein
VLLTEALTVNADRLRRLAHLALAESEEYRLNITFPRGQVTIITQDALTYKEVRERFPDAERLTLVQVHLAEGARVGVEGFGMPYRNPEDPVRKLRGGSTTTPLSCQASRLRAS